MGCIERKLSGAEREQMVDLMMHGIKRWCDHAADKGICPVCAMDAYMRGVFGFFKDIGGVDAEDALIALMGSYNRAYRGEACIVEETAVTGETLADMMAALKSKGH